MTSIKHWSDQYPHDLYASVLLLDGKIESWKVVNYPKRSPGEFQAIWKRGRLNDYTTENMKWVVSNNKEHNDVFSVHAPEWFRQWPHAEDYVGFPAYKVTMKAITVRQPFATLIAIGEKENETRGWATKYRGPLAIHAGLKVDRDACEREPIKSTLAEHGYNAGNLPTGAIVATCNLSDCTQVIANFGTDALLSNGEIVEGNEILFGDFSQGRYAWVLTDRRFLEEPIPAKGQQGLWNWKESESIG